MLRRVFSQPMEQMLALGCFCGGGVLARHPKLRVAFLEANCSWLPWLLWRLHEGWGLGRGVFAPGLKKKPRGFFKKAIPGSNRPHKIAPTNTLQPGGGGLSGFFHGLSTRGFAISRSC